MLDHFIARSYRLGPKSRPISDEELEQRRKDREASEGYQHPPSATPWQEIQRGIVDQMSNGFVLKTALKYHRISQTERLPAKTSRESSHEIQED